MSQWTRVVVAVLIGGITWSQPLRAQSQAMVQYSHRSATSLAGTLIDPTEGLPVFFSATTEDDVITVRLELDSQSVTVRNGPGELEIDSSRNTNRTFSTLSDADRRVIGQLVTLMDQDPENAESFYVSAICTMRNLSAWPTGMPLAVSFDSLMHTVGDLSIPTAEIEEARRLALAELDAQEPDDIGELAELDTEIPPARAISSLCSQIGRRKRACYPRSLVPYRERCQNVLVGGRTCRGRCGTTCNGLCSQQRYTQDCHDHDQCAGVYNLTHRYCNFIFPAAFDDCTGGPDCNDRPGVWTLRFTWQNSRPGTTRLKVFPGKPKRFTSTSGAGGSWASTDVRFTFRYTGGCRPVYSGSLSANRLRANGTMKCRKGRKGAGSGTWVASKTNRVLSGQATAVEKGEPAGNVSARPDTPPS